MRLDLTPGSRRDAHLMLWPCKPMLSYAALCLFIGISAFIMSVFATALASQISGLGVENFARANTQPRSWIDATLGYVIYPCLIETAVLFLAPLALLNRVIRPLPAMAAASAAVMILVGWIVHGVSIQALGPALSFGILGLVGGVLYRSKGMEVAFLILSISHAIWNSLTVVVWLLH